MPYNKTSATMGSVANSTARQVSSLRKPLHSRWTTINLIIANALNTQNSFNGTKQLLQFTCLKAGKYRTKITETALP